MTCAEYQETLTEVARGGESAEAWSHAENCASCALVLANEQMLSAGLRAMAAGTSGQPSAALEFALLAEFRPVRKQFGSRWAWAPIGAMATGILVLALNAGRESGQAQRVRTPSTASTIQSTLTGRGSEVFVDKRPVETVSMKARKVRRVRNAPKAANSEEAFILIPYAEPLALTERTEIVRVNLEVGALAGLGLPVQGLDPTLRLTADLVLGQDGLARAVRFVR